MQLEAAQRVAEPRISEAGSLPGFVLCDPHLQVPRHDGTELGAAEPDREHALGCDGGFPKRKHN